MHIRNNTLYLLTGSNMGDSLHFLQQAIAGVGKKVGEVLAKSAVYKTAAWGNTNQQDFLNQVLCVQTTLDPQQVLENILQVEKELGRERDVKWGPRTIDIDLLFFNDSIINEKKLTVPHPLLHERRFTLVPLNEIAAGYVHPSLHKSVTQLLSECTDNSVVEKL